MDGFRVGDFMQIFGIYFWGWEGMAESEIQNAQFPDSQKTSSAEPLCLLAIVGGVSRFLFGCRRHRPETGHGHSVSDLAIWRSLRIPRHLKRRSLD